MKTTIILGRENIPDSIKDFAGERRFFSTCSESEAHLYHIEHPDVDSYLIYNDSETDTLLPAALDHIHFVNSILPVIIISKYDIKNPADREHLIYAENEAEIPALVSAIPETHRHSNRIKWPVKARFYKSNYKEEKHSGIILSMSSDGCFIRTTEKMQKGEFILLTIEFRDFDFLTEGQIVRTGTKSSYQPEGLAVKFLNTSIQTKDCIQRIIDEKMLGELMKKLNPYQDTEM